MKLFIVKMVEFQQLRMIHQNNVFSLHHKAGVEKKEGPIAEKLPLFWTSS